MSGPRDFSLTFGGAGEREIKAAGRYLRVLATPTADVFISIDGGSELQRGAGQQVHVPAGFTRFSVRSAVAQTVRVSTSETSQDDARSNVALSVSATVAGSTAATKKPVVSVPALGVLLLVAANPKRQSVRLAIAADAAGPVWYSDSATQGANEGGLLEPGMIDYPASLSALYAYNPHATLAVDVSVLDMETP